MPSLILSSRYTTDSQRLRDAARQLGWETLRLDGDAVPEWFDAPDDRIALYYTAPHAFDVASQLSRTLLGCDPAWTVQLPPEFLKRALRQTTLREALQLHEDSFVKHANSKAFPAAIYNAASLAGATSQVPTDALVHVGEPVEWSAEYRCFVMERRVAALSPYKRYGQSFEHHSDLLGAPQVEMDTARQFAHTLLACTAVPCPPAFVLDVGLIHDRGWAVVECNECWASGIYACDPVGVLETLCRACVATSSMTDEERRWDFQPHYFAARGS